MGERALLISAQKQVSAVGNKFSLSWPWRWPCGQARWATQNRQSSENARTSRDSRVISLRMAS